MSKFIAFISTMLLAFGLKAQYCDQLYLMMSSSANIDFTFDSFSKYLNGITQNGGSLLKVTVANNVNNNPDCRWNLVAYVDNGGGASTAADEWEALTNYTSSGNAPKISLLQMRIRNRCSTALTGNSFSPVSILPGTPLYIIENNGITIPAGSCTSNVNGPGSYLMRYDEYSFDIDYRIVPGLNHKSGTYQIQIKFMLAESL